MKQTETVKLKKLELKAKKEAQELLILQQIVASPVFQMVGPIVLAEILEAMGLLTGRLSGAIEGGVITMVGLRALKDYGILGAGVFGAGIGAGSLLGTDTTEAGAKQSVIDSLTQGLTRAIRASGG